MKRTLAILLTALLLTGLVGGALAEAPKELVMWGGWSGDSVAQFTEMLDAYNNSQSEVHITYQYIENMEQKLLTAIAGGETCDVVLWDRYNTSTYAPRGALLALDDYVKEDNVDLSQFFAPTIDELTYDGKLYGLPTMVDTRVLFCNIDLLEEAGVDYTKIVTWDDLRDAAIKATKRDANGALTQSGYLMNDYGLFSAYLMQAGGELTDDSVTPPVTAFNSPEGLAVLNFWDQMVNKDKVYELGFNEAYNGRAFIAGKAAMTVDGPWNLNDTLEAGINLGIIPCPKGPGENGQHASGMGGFALAIPALAKNPREAMDFIEWWATDPTNSVLFTKINGYLPANIEAANDPFIKDNDALSAMFNAFQYGRIRPKTAGYSSVEATAMTPQWQLFLGGEITAEEALKAAQELGDEILADAAE